MKPVAIFRHAPTEGPGYFATYLQANSVPWTILKIDEGETVPQDPRAYSGLVFMGGPMSANDDLAWIVPELELIRRAVQQEVPVLGHCLGGQLMAKALGASVSRNPVKEIGWAPVSVLPRPAAKAWFGDVEEFLSFHWHGETFAIPPGGQCIASSEHCAHQVFAMDKHLGMQCHVEMTAELIRSWCDDWHKEVASLAARTASVQTPEEMQRDVDSRVEALNRVAERLYDRWIEGLAR
ncbi:MAG: glutamine amidotransferase [Betaproteobacteria bacterium RIFCSPLOWO2_12_FULL_66_14]|nr:MAG: glutamine amidotransferase [Betaproteobacteria bacterium RIFCSPLOWO2_12_FULL_66_14]